MVLVPGQIMNLNVMCHFGAKGSIDYLWINTPIHTQLCPGVLSRFMRAQGMSRLRNQGLAPMYNLNIICDIGSLICGESVKFCDNSDSQIIRRCTFWAYEFPTGIQAHTLGPCIHIYHHVLVQRPLWYGPTQFSSVSIITICLGQFSWGVMGLIYWTTAFSYN